MEWRLYGEIKLLIPSAPRIWRVLCPFDLQFLSPWIIFRFALIYQNASSESEISRIWKGIQKIYSNPFVKVHSPSSGRTRKTFRQVFNIFKGDSIISIISLGSLLKDFSIPTPKKFLLIFRWNIQFVPVLSLGTTANTLSPSSWHPPFRYQQSLINKVDSIES